MRRTSLRLHTWYAMHPHTAAHVQRQSHHLLASRTLWAPHGCGQLELKLEQSTASATRSSISARFCRSSVSDAALYSLMP